MKSEIGCFFNNYCSINARKKILIGKNTLLGEGVKIYDHNHKFNIKNIEIKNQGFNCEKVVIGNNCWLGSNTIVLKGVEIGENVVISAGSVIKESIKSNRLVNKNEISEIIFKEEK